MPVPGRVEMNPAQLRLSSLITSEGHPWVVHAGKLARGRGYRERKRRCLIGGRHIMNEYFAKAERIRDRLPADIALVPDRYALDQLPPLLRERFPAERPVLAMNLQCMSHITREPAPEGVLAEIPLPKMRITVEGVQRILILSSVSLPSNLGSLIRTAVALGWTVGVTGDYTDPFSYDAIRYSKGAVLHQPLIRLEHGELRHMRNTFSFLLATPAPLKRFEPFPPEFLPNGIRISRPVSMLKRKIALVVGNESHGLTDFPMKASGIDVTIPLTEGCKLDSLNVAVAGGIILHTLTSLSLDGRAKRGEKMEEGGTKEGVA